MDTTWHFLYTLVLALWVGGIALFTFIVTPVLFKSYSRDKAGEIVGTLFPSYFLYTLALAALAMVLFFVVADDRSSNAYRLSLILVSLAVMVNVFVLYKLHPAIVRVKQDIPSFEGGPHDSTARKKFARLHALSASLNLLVLADGVVLLLVSPFLKK